MESQKILILTERFAPEEFLVNDLAKVWCGAQDAVRQLGMRNEELGIGNRDGGDANNNCELEQGERVATKVEVLTQVPSYPYDKIFEGYRNKLFQMTTELGGMPVHRVRTVLGYNVSVKRKILNYLSFAFWTSLWAVVQGYKYDAVFIYHTGPLTMATAAWVLHFLWRKPCTIWTQDMWPEAVIAYGIKMTPVREKMLTLFVRMIYVACKTVLVSCPGFVEVLSKRIKKPVTFVPQWDIGGVELPPKPLAEKQVFMFTGNHGVPQILDRVILGFEKAQLSKAELHLVGGGVKLESLKALVEERMIPNVIFHGRQPQEKMPEFLAKADVLLLPLSSEFALTLPGKFPAYLKAGRPILGIIEGEAANLIRKECLGRVASPSDSDDIAAAFTQLSEELTHAPAQIARYSANCQRLSRGQFDRTQAINTLTNTLGCDK